MEFTGLDEDGPACYHSYECSVERAKMLNAWDESNDVIMLQRDNAPTWFARLVRGTWFEWLAYEEVKP